MKFFTISIDTEADCSADWTGAVPESYENLAAMGRRLAPLSARHGPCVTLLLNGDIIARPQHAATCARLATTHGWELGTHLHGEFAAPHQSQLSPAGIRLKDFQCGYPPDVEQAKMRSLTRAFEACFGYAPRSFRAGRFGAGQTTFDICHELGYVVESSVIPRRVVSEGAVIADFSEFGHHPVLLRGEPATGLVEIPVTVKPGLIPPWIANLYASSDARAWPRAAKLCVGALDRVLARAQRQTWLRPSMCSLDDMNTTLDWLNEQALTQPVVVANVMFHSNELLGGASPYNATEADVDHFIQKLDAIMGEARQAGYAFTTLAQAGLGARSALQAS
jgi:hypothetical protein